MSSILSFDARALRRASVAVVSVALLTACDSDDALAPKSGQVPTAAQSAVIRTNPRVAMGRVRQSYVDFVGPIAGMSLKLRDSTGADIVQFLENHAPDVEPAAGVVELKLAEGEYSICYMAPPLGYSFVGMQPGFCMWFHIKRDSISELPAIWSAPYHSTYWEVHSGVAGPDFNLNYVGPSTFTVKDVLSWATITVEDNGANDRDPRLGRLALNLPTASDYDVCQTVAPAGHYNALPSCQRVTVLSNTPAFAGWWFNQKKGTVISR